MNILVSACLLGVCCRYNGTGEENERVKRLGERHRLIPVCPAGRAKKQETAPRRRRKKISLPENKRRCPRL